MGKERFGVEPTKGWRRSKPIPNRREREIKLLRRDLRTISKQHRRSSEEEKAHLGQLTDDISARLVKLRRAEHVRRTGRERANL